MLFATISLAQEVVLYTHQNSGLPEDSVWDMMKDSQNRYWFGTGGGLVLFENGRWHTYTPQNTGGAFKGKSVVKVFRDSRGVFWFASRRTFLGGGGVTRYDGKDWELWNEKSTKGGLPSDYVWDIVEDSKGRLWFATDKGVTCYDGDYWYIYNKVNTRLGLPGDSVWDLFIDREGQLWAATDKGVGVFDGAHWKSFTKYNSDIPRENISVIFQDANGTLWLGSRAGVFGGGGLLRYDGQDWKVFDKKNTGGGLPNNDITTITQTSDGALWVGTKRGVTRFYRGRWSSFLKKEPVWDIMEDGENIFFAVSRGVAVLKRAPIPWEKGR